jgi:hypothetical protein
MAMGHETLSFYTGQHILQLPIRPQSLRIFARLQYLWSYNLRYFTMMKLIVILFLLGTSAQALNHVVAVGNGGVTFTPNSVTAAVGDSIEFQFMAAVLATLTTLLIPQSHSVAQADFSSPCTPSNGGNHILQ